MGEVVGTLQLSSASPYFSSPQVDVMMIMVNDHSNDKLLRRNYKDLKSCPVFSARGPGPVVQLLWGQLSFKAAFNIVIIINNINITTIIIVTSIISTSITISTTTTAHQVREEFNADTFSRGEQCQVQVQI